MTPECRLGRVVLPMHKVQPEILDKRTGIPMLRTGRVPHSVTNKEGREPDDEHHQESEQQPSKDDRRRDDHNHPRATATSDGSGVVTSLLVDDLELIEGQRSERAVNAFG